MGREVGRACAGEAGKPAADLGRLRSLPGAEQLDRPVVERQHAMLARLLPPQLDQARQPVGLVPGQVHALGPVGSDVVELPVVIVV